MLSTIGMGPPYHGNRARFRSLANAFANFGQVHLLGVNMPAEEFASLPDGRFIVLGNLRDTLTFRIVRKLRRLVRRRLAGPEARRNDPLDVDLDPKLLTRIAAMSERHQFDLAVVNYATFSLYLTALPDSTHKAIDTIDVLSNRRARFASIDGSEAWQSLSPDDERRALMRADTVIAIQNQEALQFRSLLPTERAVQVIEYLDRPTVISRDGDTGFQFGILSSDNPINIQSVRWFLDEVWTEFASRRPDALLLVAGGVCAHLPEHRQVTALGVLSDAERFYRQVDVCINPCLAGTGLKIKTVEALAAARCVVGSRFSADGLAAGQERGLFVAETRGDYLMLLERLSADPAWAHDSGRAGHRYLQSMYDQSLAAVARLCDESN